jgi:hypothetical protein
MWVYFTSSYTGDGPFCTSIGLSGGFTTNTWWFGPHSVNSGRVTIYNYNYSSSGPLMAESTSPPINQWVHYALVRNGNAFTIYRNGTSSATATFAGAFAGSSSGLMISRAGDAGVGNSSFDGYLSNLRVVNGSSVYTSNFTPPTSPLTAITNTGLLTLQSNRFIDNSIYSALVTISQGTPSVQRFSPFNPSIVTPTSYSGYFDGTGDYLSLPATSILDVGNTSWTIECWIYLNNVSGQKFIVGYNNTSASDFWDLRTDTGVPTFRSRIGGTEVAVSGGTVLVNTWNHIALVRNGTAVTIYLNGSSVATNANVSMPTSMSNQVLGIGTNLYTGGVDYFNGYISNLRIVKGTAVYTGNFTPSTTPLTAIANTSLLTCQSTTFIDNSTNNFTITAVGDTKPSQQNPFGYTSATTEGYTVSTIGGSGYFDGTGDYLTVPRSTLSHIPGASQNFTIEAWVYSERAAGVTGQQIMGFHANGLNSDWILDISISNYPTFYVDGLGTLITSSIIVNPYSWNHIAVVRKNTNTITLYVNGVSGGTATSSSTLVATGANPLSIGSDYNGASFVTKGYISDSRIVNGTAVYTSNFVPPSAPLTAVQNSTLLLNMTSAGISDAAMMNNMETVGDAKLSTAVSKFGGSSMSFDGNGDYVSMPATPNNRINTTGNFTIEFWAYFNTVASDQRLISWDNNTSNFVIALYTAASGVLSYYLSSTGTSWNVAQQVSMGNISATTWTHIALVRNGSVFTPYINGVAGTTTTSSATLTTSTLPFTIGGVGAGSPFNGYMDDFRITKGIARYTSNFTAPASAFATK